jgi:hypothetical protein
MMRKIVGNSSGHNLNSVKFHKSSDFMCITCATEKLILRPSPVKVKVEPLKFFRTDSRRYLWTNKTIVGSIQVFYGFN